MTNVKIVSRHLPGGWDCYCPGCDMFFSAYKNAPKETKYCPVCGWDTLITDPEEFEKAYPDYEYREERRTA